jgi:hypothetical protein
MQLNNNILIKTNGSDRILVVIKVCHTSHNPLKVDRSGFETTSMKVLLRLPLNKFMTVAGIQIQVIFFFKLFDFL